jgi:hypothetical protein
MKRVASLAITIIVAAACSQQSSPNPLAPGALGGRTAAMPSTEHFTAPFTATAMCSADIGRIQFTGMIEGTDHTTVDQQGETHRTRQFRVKDLTATNLDDGTTYRVIGGAEMLTWNTQLGHTPGAAAKSMHAGTLVFQPTSGGPNVIAHHTIHYVENGQGDVVLNFSSWRCTTAKNSG